MTVLPHNDAYRPYLGLPQKTLRRWISYGIRINWRLVAALFLNLAAWALLLKFIPTF